MGNYSINYFEVIKNDAAGKIYDYDTPIGKL